jgi:hypothetical protein
MVSAGSMLTLSVMNKTGLLDATLSLKLSKVRHLVLRVLFRDALCCFVGVTNLREVR